MASSSAGDAIAWACPSWIRKPKRCLSNSALSSILRLRPSCSYVLPEWFAADVDEDLYVVEEILGCRRQHRIRQDVLVRPSEMLFASVLSLRQKHLLGDTAQRLLRAVKRVSDCAPQFHRSKVAQIPETAGLGKSLAFGVTELAVGHVR